jgi:hypothetical protein
VAWAITPSTEWWSSSSTDSAACVEVQAVGQYTHRRSGRAVSGTGATRLAPAAAAQATGSSRKSAWLGDLSPVRDTDLCSVADGRVRMAFESLRCARREEYAYALQKGRFIDRGPHHTTTVAVGWRGRRSRAKCLDSAVRCHQESNGRAWPGGRPSSSASSLQLQAISNWLCISARIPRQIGTGHARANVPAPVIVTESRARTNARSVLSASGSRRSACSRKRCWLASPSATSNPPTPAAHGHYCSGKVLGAFCFTRDAANACCRSGRMRLRLVKRLANERMRTR